MKTLIYEIGVVDKQGNKHPVNFKKGLSVVTGKSSTGKSALIEIFDYCFGSGDNTIPKGIITTSAAIYYVALAVNDQDMVVARDPDLASKAFFRRVEKFDTEYIVRDYFSYHYFRPLVDFKKYLRSFFLDIDDVDESLEARGMRGKKSATPSIRSFSSFMFQHQNLVANKHALFYRFDEKEKRDQAIEHTKIFLGLVDQKFFHLSQEKERLSTEVKRLERRKETNKRTSESYKQNIGPIMSQLYALMGFEDNPISLDKVLRHPQDAKGQLDDIIVPEKINYNSNVLTKRYDHLKIDLNQKVVELRKLQRQASSIGKHIQEEEQFVDNIKKFNPPNHVHISASIVCPFCHAENNTLQQSAEKLQQAITKVSGNLAQARPMKAKFESSLVAVKRNIEVVSSALSEIKRQIIEIEETEAQLSEQKSLYESILMQKAKLFALLDTLDMADDLDLEKEISKINKQINVINKELKKYDVRKGLEDARKKVNKYMAEIGKYFEFEKSHQPINLHFSFETFDLYHLQGDEKIYLRSMGSGANWLYCHVTLFLALHKYFVELGEKCAIPSILFLDQPTQVYFPNFNRDTSDSFEEQKSQEEKQRTEKERPVDEDVRAVENLFSRLSVYCNELELNNGFSPQIIVTDHADNLTLSNGVEFESLVNGNRWRTRGLIDPVPKIKGDSY